MNMKSISAILRNNLRNFNFLLSLSLVYSVEASAGFEYKT